MITRPRALLILGAVLWAVAGVTYATLRANYGVRPAVVNVRWAPAVDEATRQSLERTHGLIEGKYRAGRTWAYLLTDMSTENIRDLIQNRAVEDTHYLHRTAFRTGWRTPRGEYQTEQSASLASLLEFVIRASVLLGTAALGLGAAKMWWAGRGRPAARTMTPPS